MNLRDSILATLSYHDIFDYPLTQQEIYKFLISKKASAKTINRELQLQITHKKIETKSGLYFLRGRRNINFTRKSREKHSRKKFTKAKFYARLLLLIPTVRIVAISGALAMNNSHEKDDIDFVLISQSGTIWTTRFFSNLILFPFKRKPKSKKTSDKACLNLFLDEADLKLKNHNIYQAHELCQMKILVSRGKTYSKLIKSNQWVTKFLPNWQPDFSQEIVKKTVNFKSPKIIESFLKSAQLSYMRKKVTTEKIGDRQLFFHPKDTENFVLNKYRKRLSRLKITFRI